VASGFSRFFAELRRRKVYHLAAAYATVGVGISLGVPDLFSAFDLPHSAARLVIILVAVGFPVALVLAWAYELKPEDPPPAEPDASQERVGSEPRIAGQKPSVAILPFANLSADPDNEYFSDGVTEEIINAVAAIRQLRVTARTSAFQFKGSKHDIREIGISKTFLRCRTRSLRPSIAPSPSTPALSTHTSGRSSITPMSGAIWSGRWRRIGAPQSWTPRISTFCPAWPRSTSSLIAWMRPSSG